MKSNYHLLLLLGVISLLLIGCSSQLSCHADGAAQLLQKGDYLLLQGQLEAAEAAYEVAYQHCPSPESLFGLAAASLQSGRFLKASNYARLLIERWPNDGRGYALNGYIFQSRGQFWEK